MRRNPLCGQCGEKKITLSSGALRCRTCRNKCLRNYYNSSPTRRAKQRQTYLSRHYGASMAALEALLEQQRGACAICLRPWRCCNGAKVVRFEKVFLQYVYVDHDHATGGIRGLLCNSCNTAIGLLEDDPNRIRNAIRYLEENAGRQCRH